MHLNLQLFGGRGGSSGSASGGGASMPKVTKHSASEIANMTRAQAVAAARPIFIRNNMRMGLSKAEATRRFNALEDGNTLAQLKKYIKRNQ